MTSPRPSIVIATLLASMLPASTLVGATLREAASGRALVKQFADTVVTVELVVTVRMSVGDRALPPRESKVDVNATVISQSGLTVTVLSMVDPRSSLEAMRAAQGAGASKIEIGETEFKDVKLRLANNTEVPADVVLKDPDLNLIFIAPVVDAAAPARKFTSVRLDKAVDGEILGNYFLVSRAPKSLQRVPLVRMTTVMGIVEKPRKMFLLSEQALGIPIFDSSGLVLGIGTQYLENGRATNPVVLSAADVAELAAQAAAAKPVKADSEEQTTPPVPLPATKP
jgi:hypothetical protein